MSEKSLEQHVAEALAFERRRQPVTMVGRESKSKRPMCLGCGFGIRLETTPVEGMHPKCHKVAFNQQTAVQHRVNTIAARVPADIKRVLADEATRKAHADLLARLEASEAARDESAS